jgi:hypothetical protein
MTCFPTLSPSALNRFLACEYRTCLDMLERRGEFDAERRPPDQQLLMERGEIVEDDVLDRMHAEGIRVISLDTPNAPRQERAARTIDAMRDGYDVIHQGAGESGAEGSGSVREARYVQRPTSDRG